MADVFTSEKRSEIMGRVKSKDTSVEKFVRSLLHRLGYRFRINRKDLPGCPDIVFPSRKKVIFVHGCFWHGHGCRRGARIPKTNTEYWLAKVEKNRRRDEARRNELEEMGWKVLTVWECEIADIDAVRERLITFLAQEIIIHHKKHT